MKKTAYCLGINDYDRSGFYGKGSNLNGCIQDTETMKGILLKAGFDVIVLTNEQCTKERVIEIYAQFERDSEAGDILLVFTSGHGTFKMEGGERHTGICLWNGVFWDSDYRSCLSRIKANRGYIHIPDTCFSQDNWKMALPTGTRPAKLKYLPVEKASNPGQLFTLKYAKGLKISCNVIAITSSTDQQPSYDLGAKGGHFTLSLAKAVDTSDSIANYFEVFNKTARIMAASPYPQNPTFAVKNGNVWKWTYRNFLD